MEHLADLRFKGCSVAPVLSWDGEGVTHANARRAETEAVCNGPKESVLPGLPVDPNLARGAHKTDLLVRPKGEGRKQKDSLA